MALETLLGRKEIGGFKALDLDAEKARPDFSWEAYDEARKESPIGICHSENMISFRIQNGPIQEAGVNGCQVDTLIEAARIIITRLNEKSPCRENSIAITKLQEASMWLAERKRDRESRGVEGCNKE